MRRIVRISDQAMMKMADAKREAHGDAKIKGPGAIVRDLHDLCTASLARSFDTAYDALNANSYRLATDLDCWTKVLESRPEQALYAAASAEYILALLNNAQGQYRNAFKSLRLVLELVLQGVYLSVNLVTLREWLASQADTSWNAILDGDKGIFAKRFCRAFFPELDATINEFKNFYPKRFIASVRVYPRKCIQPNSAAGQDRI